MEGTYKTVRALERGLEILFELNKIGRATPAQLSKATGIDRTTTYRLLHTLAAQGLVGRSPAEDSFYLLRDTRRLSDGFIETDQVLWLAGVELGKMLLKVQWPSDYATFDRGTMLIQETTHRFSSLSVHRNMVGRRRTLFSSALGRAVLAGATDSEREMILQITESSLGRPAPRNIDSLLEDFHQRGYTWSVGGSEGHISAIALPIKGKDRVVGAVNIVFFRRASTPEEIAEKHLDSLKSCVAAIEAGITKTAEDTRSLHGPTPESS
ncbi:helix-turn-helix domain-containing protein [Acidocella aquatica]|nr:IclR family transcriptional regulator C-terminal domain-containing protein [Acidocella aquatica]